ncbi:hypothetical protein BH23CHL2_BH23CHL2_30820 [soil metagenome]
MTSPASAQFPWSDVPEPPSGEFRSGRLPAQAGGGNYIAARGSRPGPALLALVGPWSGYPAVHGVFRLADVLDAHRLAGSLLIRLAGDDAGEVGADLLVPAGGLLQMAALMPGWSQLATAGTVRTGQTELDDQASRIAKLGGAPFHFALETDESQAPVSAMARRGRLAVRWTVPDDPDERAGAVEQVFQGAINMLRGFGMLEGQIVPPESRELHPPARAIAPVAGYWLPVARPGQRIRINDSLGSFRDGQGSELGELLTNVSGILLGISNAVWVEAGEPVAELARPID